MKLSENYRYNISNVMCLDVYLSSLNREEYEKIKHRIKPTFQSAFPLMCMDVALNSFNLNVKNEDQFFLRKLEEKYNWHINISELLQNPYQAILVTDIEQRIKWISNGFTRMTGYNQKNLINKTPKFLQGANTLKESTQNIRKYLASSSTINFKETVVNYRKNHEEYLCEINLFPVKNYRDQITHYIALESEII